MRRGNRIYRSNYSGRRNHSPLFSQSGESSFFPAQAKLTVGQPGDRFEQEADRAADAVVNQNVPDSSLNGLDSNGFRNTGESISEGITPLVQQEMEEVGVAQRQPMEEEEEIAQPKLQEEEEPVQAQAEEEEEPVQAKEEGEELQMQEEEEAIQGKAEEEEEELQMQAEEEEEEIMPKAEGSAQPASSVESTLASSPGSGSKMDNNIRSEMESGFGADFSQVRIHTGHDAVNMNRQMGAQAFAHGNDIYFNEGKYDPISKKGKHLLAHELTHTIQQKGFVKADVQTTMDDNRDLVSDRFSGNLRLEACLDGERTLGYGSTGRPVSLIQQALVDAGFPLPVYGVDGIFKNETKAAVESFQRSSSLPVTGIIDARTMASLDGLFSWGAPTLPTGTPATEAPSITSSTISIAPDGTADERTLVGVGEFVRFTGNTEGTWTVTGGRIIGLNTGQNMVWEAPPVPMVSIITLTNQAGSASMIMSTKAPDSITLERSAILPIPAGTLGAAMEAAITVHPLNVNFGRTQWFEEPGPATSVSGYFNQFSAADLHHDPNPDYLPFDDMNTGLTDEAAWRGGNPPFSRGYHEWVIPNKYKIDGESDAQGRLFTNVTQSFFVTPGGSFMVAKAGAFIFRTLNNFTI